MKIKYEKSASRFVDRMNNSLFKALSKQIHTHTHTNSICTMFGSNCSRRRKWRHKTMKRIVLFKSITYTNTSHTHTHPSNLRHGGIRSRQMHRAQTTRKSIEIITFPAYKFCFLKFYSDSHYLLHHIYFRVCH